MRKLFILAKKNSLFFLLMMIMLTGCGGGGTETGVNLNNGSGSDATAVTLTWNGIQNNTDGTAITDLGGYKVYYGSASDNLSNSVDVGKNVSCVINDLVPGNTYYFAVTAYDTAGNESDFSSAVSILM